MKTFKKIYHLLFDSIFLLLTLTLSACSLISACSKLPKGQSEVILTINDYQLKTEIADTIKKKSVGLMNRKSLPENNAMLFIFPVEQYLNFWMKNTYIPLSIAFIDKNGIILEIVDMKPLDISIIRSNYKALYALEVNQGWFKQHNIKEGMKIKEL
ncbi:MAG: hypothetical protein A2252_08940 [Elusimicrobia bacterium RIFOXYA2_FULL_39_19]|nr:MAG: hypothetical protein A2252_08940 [Elusimicrobia bacterium RIFOXYA2_FULL_39_19]